MQDGHDGSAYSSQPRIRASTQPPIGTDASHVTGELRKKSRGHHNADTDFVHRCGYRLQQSMGRGERTSGPHRDDDRGQAKALVEGTQCGFEHERAAEADAGEPRGQREPGQLEQHRGSHRRDEQNLCDESKHDDDECEPKEEPKRSRPGSIGAPTIDHNGRAGNQSE